MYLVPSQFYAIIIPYSKKKKKTVIVFIEYNIKDIIMHFEIHENKTFVVKDLLLLTKPIFKTETELEFW